MFSGVIYPDQNNVLGGLAGEMNDQFGQSQLSHVILFPDERVKFVKKYNHRDDRIEYEFIKEGSIWVGKYSGPVVKEGNAKCIITQVPEELFLPPQKT